MSHWKKKVDHQDYRIFLATFYKLECLILAHMALHSIKLFFFFQMQYTIFWCNLVIGGGEGGGEYMTPRMWILLVLQMHVADGGLPQYIPSCHFPNSLCITLPLWSTTVPSTSFILEFQYFACNAYTKKQRCHHCLSPTSLRSTQCLHVPNFKCSFWNRKYPPKGKEKGCFFMHQIIKQLSCMSLKADYMQYMFLFSSRWHCWDVNDSVAK